jgi:hypothetical protein
MKVTQSNRACVCFLRERELFEECCSINRTGFRDMEKGKEETKESAHCSKNINNERMQFIV